MKTANEVNAIYEKALDKQITKREFTKFIKANFKSYFFKKGYEQPKQPFILIASSNWGYDCFELPSGTVEIELWKL
jgi:hypothetical protein